MTGMLLQCHGRTTVKHLWFYALESKSKELIPRLHLESQLSSFSVILNVSEESMVLWFKVKVKGIDSSTSLRMTGMLLQCHSERQ